MDFLYEFETNNYYDIKRIYFKIKRVLYQKTTKYNTDF